MNVRPLALTRLLRLMVGAVLTGAVRRWSGYVGCLSPDLGCLSFRCLDVGLARL